MDISGGEMGAGTPEESWRDIHETMDKARSSMYVAGTSTIMLLWAAIASVGVGSQYAILTLASEFAERSPWIFGVLWGILMVPGMVGSGFIGRRAGRKIAAGDAARSAGIRVFLYWLAVVVAIFLIPAAAGMWNAEDGDSIPAVAIGHSVAGIHPVRHHAPPGVGGGGRGVRGSVLHSQLPRGRLRGYVGVGGIDGGSGGTRCVVDTQERGPLTDEPIVLNKSIHSPSGCDHGITDRVVPGVAWIHKSGAL